MFQIYIFLYKNTDRKNFRLSFTVSTLNTYYVADTKNMKGASYYSVLTCSLLITNLCHKSLNGFICEGKFVIFRLRNLIMYVFLNVTMEHAELVIQIFVKRKHKSLSPNTLRNYCHS